MSNSGVGFIWLSIGPLLLVGFAKRYPFRFVISLIFATAIAYLCTRRMRGWKQKLSFMTIAYVLLVLEWFFATQFLTLK